MIPLRGEQYVQLAPGVAETLAPHVGMSAETICELALDLAYWPHDIAVMPRRSREGRLVAGDPLLLAVGQEGLSFAAWRNRVVLVRWTQVRGVRVLRRVERLKTTSTGYGESPND